MNDWITVRVAAAQGSTPREVGAAMRVFAQGQEGTIGGGALEWAAASHARQMLRQNQSQDRRKIPLGPDMGQCCGGVVTLEYTLNAAAKPHTAPPLWIWGAGHVGRAIAAVLAPFGDRQITLVDIAPARLPDPLPAGVAPLIAQEPARAVPHAPAEATHLVLTHSHDLDLRLCDALLRHGFESCGLIGSATKWARFRKRLGEMGHGDAEISRITCPIGVPELGKHPQAIAVGVAQRLLKGQLHKDPAPKPGKTRGTARLDATP